MSEHRKYRKFTAKQKLEIVLASLGGDRLVAEICREHGIAESLYASGASRRWRRRLSGSSSPRSGRCRSSSAARIDQIGVVLRQPEVDEEG
ncbi:MAG TPA: transposase [Gaiellaceae bacterium]|nr:transposase [Gaiellaceae bacterium]